MPRTTLAPTGTPPDDAAWRAVLHRNRAARGRFVFGLVTTGISCAPGCPARLPRRRGLRCFSSPVALSVPCHRAVGKDGGVHRYRWRLEQKRALLAEEAAGD